MTEIEIDPEFLKKINSRGCEVHNRIQEIVHQGIFESKTKLLSKLNKDIYELAEKQGVSIWTICLNYVPQIEYEHVIDENGSCRLVQTATLLPLRIVK